MSDDPSLRVRFPNEVLRKFVMYTLNRQLDAEEELDFTAHSLGNVSVPAQLAEVVQAIEVATLSDFQAAFANSLRRLDEVVATMFGLPEEHLEYILQAMNTDGFLRQLRPNYEHRGIRVQAYADHGDAGRYQ